MWIQSKYGFYSVVEHREDNGVLLIRARKKSDLINLCALAKERGEEIEGFLDKDIVHTPEADYRWRLLVPRSSWQQVVSLLAEDIDYDNFKNAVARSNRERADLYHQVWATLLAIEEEQD